MRKLICIPTYNEVDNIGKLIEAIAKLKLDYDIVVIDDNSPDGTAAEVKRMIQSYSNLELIQRSGNRSFALSYIEGFRVGIENDYAYIGEMDADFSHNPKALLDVDKLLTTNLWDFIIGSRYVRGGRVVNWGTLRRMISKLGSFYARTLLSIPIYDLTGGFNFWSKACLQEINIDRIMADGYVFQIELKARAFQQGMTFKEFPILFEDRRVGKSKMSNKTVLEAVLKVILLRFELRRKRRRVT